MRHESTVCRSRRFTRISVAFASSAASSRRHRPKNGRANEQNEKIWAGQIQTVGRTDRRTIDTTAEEIPRCGKKPYHKVDIQHRYDIHTHTREQCNVDDRFLQRVWYTHARTYTHQPLSYHWRRRIEVDWLFAIVSRLDDSMRVNWCSRSSPPSPSLSFSYPSSEEVEHSTRLKHINPTISIASDSRRRVHTYPSDGDSLYRLSN